MKSTFIVLLSILSIGIVYSQTNTVTSGSWSDPTVWSTGTVPAAGTDVNVINPLILDQNIDIGSGDFIIFQNVTDASGGGASSLTAITSGGVLDIRAGTTTFEGNASFTNCALTIRDGATLILGNTTFNNNNTIIIEAGGTLIVNGVFTNSNSSGSFTLNGTVYVNGSYNTNNGNIDIGGSGNIFSTGPMTTQGSSDIFGSTEDCNTGPCSGRNLCNFTNRITSSAQTVCSGTTPATITADTPGPVYIWESSTTSAIIGFNTAIGTNNIANYSPSSLTQTTWFRRKVTQGGCTGISAPIQITVVPLAGGWKGTTSDWNLNTNWCNNTVPTSATDVTISTGVTNMPQITASSFCNNLSIASGASVTINGSNSFSLFGNLVNNGSFNTNNSTVSLTGNTQQTISGSPINFNNLTINNTSTNTPQVTVGTFVNVLTNLTMTAGSINLSGYNLTLGANAGSIGALAYTAGRFYNGEFTRWMPTSVIADGSVTGLFPMGSDAHNRPFYVSYPVTAPNPGGRIKVSHTGALTTTTGLSVSDPPSTISIRQNSFWTVSTNGLSGGTYNLRVGGTGFGTIQEVSDLRLMQLNSVVGAAGINGGTTTVPQVSRTGLTLANLSSSFYIGSVDPVNTTLPIELLKFAGEKTNEGVYLTWSTAAEKDFDYFFIEHSTDGLRFNELTQVEGNGGEQIKTDYNFLHETPSLGKNYYRLKSVDLDGSYVYSKIIFVEYDGDKHLALYPNPSNPAYILYQANFEISLTDRISIVDQLGRQIAFGMPEISNQQINFSETLQPGVYVLKYTGNEFEKVMRLVIK